MKLSDLGLSKNISTAQPPECNCGNPNCNPSIMGKNFESKEEVIGFAINICNEFECNHVFAFVKFKDNECAIGFKEPLENSEEYDWNVYKIKWSDIKSIKQYMAEVAEIHFAAVLEETKDGDFKVITK